MTSDFRKSLLFAVVGLAICALGYGLAVYTSRPVDPCKQIRSQITYVGTGLIGLGKKDIVCAYDVGAKQWKTLELPAEPAPAAPQ